MKKEDINKICKIAVEAGKAVLEVYNSGNFEIETKKDNSPLTLADTASNEIIEKGLEGLKQEGTFFPILSEEGNSASYETRKNWKKYWLVDPLDGTKEFVKRNGEFTVNIAFVENSIPAAGFVYVPVKDILYFAEKDSGSFKLEKASEVDSTDIFIHAEKLDHGMKAIDIIKVVASRSHLNKETEEFIKKLEKRFGKIETVSSGSSIKLCMVAEGKADVYPCFAPTMEWDTAAAHAICRYAGVKVIDYKTKEELKYNKEDLLNNWFLVSSNKIFEEIK